MYAQGSEMSRTLAAANMSGEKFQISFISCQCPMGFNSDSLRKTQSASVKNWQVYDLLLNISDEKIFPAQYFGDSI